MNKITVDKETIERAIGAAFSPYCAQDLGILVPALRAALAESVVELDPCPACKKGTVCRTPSCGRLKLKASPPPPAEVCPVAEVKALAEPAVCSQKGYKIVPIKPPEEALAAARRAYRNATVYDVAHVWHAIITALPNSPPPVEVLLLDDMSILRMWHETSSRVPMCNHYNHFARAIEQAVRQKAGLK